MAYAILRVSKLKTAGNAGGLNAHLERKMEVPNADPDLTHLNKRQIGSGDLVSDIEKRLEGAGIKPRTNAVLAVEYLMAFSPEMVSTLKKVALEEGKYTLNSSKEEFGKLMTFQQESLKWLSARHGRANIVNFTTHYDEQTPHIHAVVVPIDGKGKLNCRSFLGGREKLREMQDSFAKVHEGIGLERGVKGSKAEHEEVKRFYTRLPELNASPSELFKQAEIGKAALEEKSVLESEREALKMILANRNEIIQRIIEGKLSPQELKSQIEKQEAAKKETSKQEIKKVHKGPRL